MMELGRTIIKNSNANIHHDLMGIPMCVFSLCNNFSLLLNFYRKKTVLFHSITTIIVVSTIVYPIGQHPQQILFTFLFYIYILLWLRNHFFHCSTPKCRQECVALTIQIDFIPCVLKFNKISTNLNIFK